MAQVVFGYRRIVFVSISFHLYVNCTFKNLVFSVYNRERIGRLFDKSTNVLFEVVFLKTLIASIYIYFKLYARGIVEFTLYS